ncbi:TIGR00725 family protein [Methanocrinis sp.]|uniref:TIGR00725 family protein n=1 Tax=Methanocrinis sp. TaxID=3101522 RepID=UPI003D14E8FA
MQMAVVGAGEYEENRCSLAREVGRKIAEHGHVLITGGLGGVMEAASEGAKEAGGVTVGILPGEKETANPFVMVAIGTGMGHGRNAIIVRSADAVIALPGIYGTLSEIALALKMDKLVIDLGDWNVDGMIKAESPEEAMLLAEGKAKAESFEKSSS